MLVELGSKVQNLLVMQQLKLKLDFFSFENQRVEAASNWNNHGVYIQGLTMQSINPWDLINIIAEYKMRIECKGEK